ncbi:chymotrypsin family serine protease [Auraticoccus monumenti]|uniref:Trypsin-like peptidase domain-containing protein n=1 Tax=Auraticoccus monumenti TaxID=675864 RepID=A0A1G6TMR4_9ACTN|nr:hypothetical protein [Auraticoccus monumenti]SDD30388.1 hypothetical protein SAMN04489747_0660 [Auraticoccus monumenti]
MTEQGAESQARSRIRPVKERVEDALILRPGVVGVDIAEKQTGGEPTGQLSIVVFVEQKLPAGDVPAEQLVPDEIDGIPTDVQELEIELQPGSMKVLAGDEPLLDPAVYPTMVGGISMGPQRTIYLAPPDVPSPGNYVFSGTLGAMVRDRASGATMALTNFHVACVDTTWSVGDVMVQPSRADDDANDDPFGTLARAQLTDTVDGAVVRLDAGQAWDATVTGIGAVAGRATATVGMAVQKRGRTTEHTFGSVVSTDFTLQVDYGNGIGVRTFRHQLRIAPDTTRSPRFSDRGDSGSVVMDTARNVVGLLFAGSRDGSFTFANPIQMALDALGVDLITGPVVTGSRMVICQPSRIKIFCGGPLISRQVVCVTRAVWCPTRTVITCPPPTRRPICWDQEWPFDPPGPFGPGQGAPSAGDAVAASGVPAGASAAELEAYWAGYLTALEEAVAAEQQGEQA